MFVFSAHDYMSDDQIERWSTLLRRLKHLQDAHPGRYVFHGTSEAAARRIMADGFEPGPVALARRDLERCGGPKARGIYWGRLIWAERFAAERAGKATGFPVVLVARLEDVIAAGTPVADPLALVDAGDPHDGIEADWRASFERAGAFVSLDCRRVAGMSLASPARPGEKLAYASAGADVLMRRKSANAFDGWISEEPERRREPDAAPVLRP